MSSTSLQNTIWHDVDAAIGEAPPRARVGVEMRWLGRNNTLRVRADEDFTAASTIKVMILTGLANAVDSGELRLDQPTPVLGASQKVGGSGVLNWLADGVTLSLADHAWLMTAISDNTASNVLIDAVGIDRINKHSAVLGVTSSFLRNRFLGRMPEPGQPRNRVTPTDLASVLQAIAEDRAASAEHCAWMRQLLADQQHRNRLARRLPDGVVYAGKTGTLNEVAHDCGILTGPGGTLVLAVLTEGIEDAYEADAFVGAIGAAAGRLIAGS